MDHVKKKLYFPNLDGLRFLCFLSVFFYHSFYTEYSYIKDSSTYRFIKQGIFGNGNLGVNFFFVLSGFLITTLLIEEKRLNGTISLRFFWLRRILRIWPLFYFCCFFGFVIFPFIKSHFGQVPNETAHPLAYLTFTNNFDFIKNGLPDSSVLGVLWSVAIEEQFYLLWPIVILAFPVKKLWIPFALIIGTSLVFRAMNDTYIMHEHHTLSCIGDMTIGALGAWLIEMSGSFRQKIASLNRYVIFGIYSGFIIIYFFRQQLLLQNYGVRIFERAFIAIFIILIILEQNYSENSFFKMSRFRRISKLGLVTYGLYCLHFIGILIATNTTKKLHFNTHLWQVLIVDTAIALTLAIIFSKLSFKYFEKPFLRFKDKFSFISK